MLTNEDYVDLATAEVLKQKGYDEYTDEGYSNDNPKGEWRMYHRQGKHFNAMPAPTLYEAAKWLREQHGYHVDVQPTISMESWYWCVTGHKSTHREDDNRDPQTYTAALLAGIKEALTLIPDKQ